MAGPLPPALPQNIDGSLRDFTVDEIVAMDIRRRGMRDGSHARYDFGPDGVTCRRKFSCLWSQRWQALIYFVGASKLYTPSSTGALSLSRLQPLFDYDFSNAWACTKCNYEPYHFMRTVDSFSLSQHSQPLPIYERADFDAVFEAIPYNTLHDGAFTTELERYVIYPGYPGCEITTETNYIGLPQGGLQYTTTSGAGVPAGTPVPYPIGFPESYSAFRMIWLRVPIAVWSPTSALQQRVLGNGTTPGYLGAVNLTAFQDYAPLTLQLRGVEVRGRPDPMGLGYSADITYIFSQKPVPYGHLGFYYRDIPNIPTGNPGTASGYYLTLGPAAGKTTLPPASIGDYQGLFPVREFANLFSVS